MKSMTGHGRGEAAQDGLKVTVELSSVNRKQGEILLHLPREIEALEPRLRDAINRRVARGRLTVRVLLQTAEDSGRGRVRVDLPLARAYVTALTELRRQLGLEGSVTLDSLVRFPGVVQTGDPEADLDLLGRAVDLALEKALTGFLKMRQTEGRHLARDLEKRIAVMRKLVATVRRRVPASRRDYQQALLTRIRAAGLETLSADDERVVREVVFYADRSDITEELTRLESHFGQFADCLASAEPVGRTLDFLAQEMGREINTMGSKANDPEISRAVVLLKAELEKFREQAQNVE